MAHFSNGTEGEIYYATYCENCVHDDPDNDVFCTVWLLHMLPSDNYKDACDILIPVLGSENLECTMFCKAKKDDVYQEPHVDINQHLVNGKLVF